jgi:hypothetical protein
LEENNLEKFKKITLRDFIIGKNEIDFQLTPKRVLGYGIVLEQSEKDIHPV